MESQAKNSLFWLWQQISANFRAIIQGLKRKINENQAFL
jgi:hypothetical protein